MDRDFNDRMQRLLEELDRHLQNLDRLAAERRNRPTDAHSPIAAVAGNASVALIRFCKDCHFSELHMSPKEQWICAHPSSLYQEKQSLVTGHIPEPRQLQCWEARFAWDNYCGKAGRHGESR